METIYDSLEAAYADKGGIVPFAPARKGADETRQTKAGRKSGKGKGHKVAVKLGDAAAAEVVQAAVVEKSAEVYDMEGAKARFAGLMVTLTEDPEIKNAVFGGKAAEAVLDIWGIRSPLKVEEKRLSERLVVLDNKIATLNREIGAAVEGLQALFLRDDANFRDLAKGYDLTKPGAREKLDNAINAFFAAEVAAAEPQMFNDLEVAKAEKALVAADLVGLRSRIKELTDEANKVMADAHIRNVWDDKAKKGHFELVSAS